MANTIDTTRLAATAAKNAAEEADNSFEKELRKLPDPILDGESISITSQNDFEKLIELFKDKYEQFRLKYTALTLSNALGQLLGMAKGLNESQKVILEMIQKYADSLKKIAENMTLTKEERAELRRKLKKAEEKRDLLATQLELAEAARAQVKDDSEEAKTLDQTIKELKGDLASQQQEIKDYNGKIAECDRKLAAAELERASVQAKLDEAAKKLDTRGRSLLFTATRVTAAQLAGVKYNDKGTDAEDEEKLRQLDICQVLSEALAKSCEELRDEIIRKRMETI